jgi:hypothetical protein
MEIIMGFFRNRIAAYLLERYQDQINEVVLADINRKMAARDPVLEFELVRSNNYPSPSMTFAALRSSMVDAARHKRRESLKETALLVPAAATSPLLAWMVSLAMAKTTILETAMKIQEHAPTMMIKHAYDLAEKAHPIATMVASQSPAAGYAAIGAVLAGAAFGIVQAARANLAGHEAEEKVVDQVISAGASNALSPKQEPGHHHHGPDGELFSPGM